MNTENLCETFNESGFVEVSVFDEEQINNVAVDFYNRLQLQAYKLGCIEDLVAAEYGDTIVIDQLDDLVMTVNNKNKVSLDFAVAELRECPALYALVTDSFLDTASRLLGCPTSLLKIHFDGVLVNIPVNVQRLYKFHSEAHYYPKRRNFLNFWMPVFKQKSAENGTMIVKKGGHKKDLLFNEYSGFNKLAGTTTSESNYFYQLEIPNASIAEFEDHHAIMPRGTALFFHQNLPHTSTVNHSEAPSYALIARVYDYRGDPTLSDYTSIKSYSSNAAAGGFPNLRVFESS